MDGISIGQGGRIHIRAEAFPKLVSAVQAGKDLFISQGFRLDAVEFHEGKLVLLPVNMKQMGLFDAPTSAMRIAETIADAVQLRTDELVTAATEEEKGPLKPQIESSASSEEDPSRRCEPLVATSGVNVIELPPEPRSKSGAVSRAQEATDNFLASVVRHGFQLEIQTADGPKKIDLPGRHQLPRVSSPSRSAPLDFRVECLMAGGRLAIDNQRRQLVFDGFELQVGDCLSGSFLIGSTVSYRMFRIVPGAQYSLTRRAQTINVQTDLFVRDEGNSTETS